MSASDVSRETLIERYFPERLDEIAAYAHFLTTAGIERGLIGPREGERIWERHIFNCLPVTQLLPQGASLFDIGSGAGLPGIVIAISIVYLGIRTLRPLYQEMPLLILAQVLIFLPLAVASMRTAIAMSTQSLEHVARSLGAGSMMTLLRVTIPLALPGIMAAGALSMLSSVKELPATLLLRPTGTETLATQIWKFSAVSDYASVGPFALAMILLAVVPVAVLTATTRQGIAR